MKKIEKTLKLLEAAPEGEGLDSLDETIRALKWNQDGLIPAIAQDSDTQEVLMLAWMNEDALRETLETKKVCYWSRSRQKLWRKGEMSGQSQTLHNIYTDCDGDTILIEVSQLGSACHTGRRSCFYNQITNKGTQVCLPILKDPNELYAKADDNQHNKKI